MAFPPLHGGSPGYRQHFDDVLAGYGPGYLGLLSLTVFENDIKLLQVALIYVWIPSTVFLFSLSYSSVPRLRQALRHRDSERTLPTWIPLVFASCTRCFSSLAAQRASARDLAAKSQQVGLCGRDQASAPVFALATRGLGLGRDLPAWFPFSLAIARRRSAEPGSCPAGLVLVADVRLSPVGAPERVLPIGLSSVLVVTTVLPGRASLDPHGVFYFSFLLGVRHPPFQRPGLA